MVITLTKQKPKFPLNLFTIKVQLDIKHTFEGPDSLRALTFSFTGPTYVTSVLPIIIESKAFFCKVQTMPIYLSNSVIKTV